jgi:hypothetical protein
MNATLSGGNLTAPSVANPNDTVPPMPPSGGLTPDSDPEVQRVQDAWQKLQGMLESGQLKVNDNIHQMFAEEAQKLQQEPTTQAPGPGAAFAAGVGGLLSSSALNNPGIAQGVFSTLDQRRKEALASNDKKVASLRDLRLQELDYQSKAAQQAGDTKAALQAEESKATLQAKITKEDEAKAAARKTQEQEFELQKIRLLNSGRENVARIHMNQKLDDIMKGYEVPKFVAQMMQDNRKGIQSSTDRYILAKGGMNMIDADELARLQAQEKRDMDAGDQRLLQQYKEGKLTPGATNTHAGAPGANSVHAPAANAHQQKIDEIRKNALGQ